MLKARTIVATDRPRLDELFRKQGFDYELPHLSGLAAAHAIEDEGQIITSVLARPTIELYFLQDPAWRSPAWRLEALRKIHETMRRDLHGKGFEDVHAFLPPQKKSFGGRLMREFGWTHPQWYPLTRSTEPRG